MDGYGEFTWGDGRTYKGMYKEDRKHGRGVFTWPDGRRYDGEWVEGKQHGIGMYISRSGLKRQGIWENGKRVRWVEPRKSETLRSSGRLSPGHHEGTSNLTTDN